MLNDTLLQYFLYVRHLYTLGNFGLNVNNTYRYYYWTLDKFV
jgi:hypothetical protein